MHTIHRIQISLVLAGVLAAGCEGGDPSPSTRYSSLGPRHAAQPLPFAWPPKRGEAYPDLRLSDHRGELVQLSSFESNRSG